MNVASATAKVYKFQSSWIVSLHLKLEFEVLLLMMKNWLKIYCLKNEHQCLFLPLLTPPELVTGLNQAIIASVIENLTYIDSVDYILKHLKFGRLPAILYNPPQGGKRINRSMQNN